MALVVFIAGGVVRAEPSTQILGFFLQTVLAFFLGADLQVLDRQVDDLSAQIGFFGWI